MRIHRLIPLLFVLGACESDPLGVGDVSVEVELLGSPTQARSLRYEVKNHGSRSVYVAACDNQVVGIVQREEGPVWVDLNSAMCLGTVSSAPLELEPGESTIGFSSITTSGQHRVGVLLRSGPNDQEGDEIALSDRVTVP